MRCAAHNTCQCAVLHGDRVNRKHTCHTIAHQLTLIRTSSEHPGSASVEQRVDPTRDLIAILATEALFIVIIPILLVLRSADAIIIWMATLRRPHHTTPHHPRTDRA